MRDAELRNVSDLGGFEVAVLSEIATAPVEAAIGFGVDAGDDLHQRRFAATGGADDGHEVAAG